MSDPPLFVRDGPAIVVAGPPGERYEVMRDRMRNRKTGRYRRIWSARRVGVLGWSTASKLRDALGDAAYVRAGRRPAWLTAAVAEVEARYAEHDAKEPGR